MSFPNCSKAVIIPVGDLLNHGGDRSNVIYTCDEKNGAVLFQATRDIETGEELTTDYLSGETDTGGMGMLQAYGFVAPKEVESSEHDAATSAAAQDRWPEEDCIKLREADLGHRDSG